MTRSIKECSRVQDKLHRRGIGSKSVECLVLIIELGKEHFEVGFGVILPCSKIKQVVPHFRVICKCTFNVSDDGRGTRDVEGYYDGTQVDLISIKYLKVLRVPVSIQL